MNIVLVDSGSIRISAKGWKQAEESEQLSERLAGQ